MLGPSPAPTCLVATCPETHTLQLADPIERWTSAAMYTSRTSQYFCWVLRRIWRIILSDEPGNYDNRALTSSEYRRVMTEARSKRPRTVNVATENTQTHTQSFPYTRRIEDGVRRSTKVVFMNDLICVYRRDIWRGRINYSTLFTAIQYYLVYKQIKRRTISGNISKWSSKHISK
jgi:hypothetical protein